MAGLPPPPTNDQTGSYAWLEWFRQLRNYISTVGSVPWNIINFTGSNISDIASRSHQSLQALQGGTTGQYYHLTQAEQTDLAAQNNVVSTAIDYTLITTDNTVYVTATGKTITLPAASTAHIGRSWTINFSTTGTLTIQRQGSDTIMTPTNATETSITVTERGTSIELKCNTATTWIIV